MRSLAWLASSITAAAATADGRTAADGTPTAQEAACQARHTADETDGNAGEGFADVEEFAGGAAGFEVGWGGEGGGGHEGEEDV